MRAIYATDLSAASRATIENETCLDCLERVGVDEVHLLTVVPSNVHAGMPGMNLEQRRERGLKEYQSVMEEAGFDVETHIVRGTPHRRINGVAETVRADMTIIGSRGQSPLENRVIGSTARNLARTTVVPLLVNRIEREAEEPEMFREHLFQRMLYATDFSENAERAFDAFNYLRHATEEATLVHVQSPKEELELDPQSELDKLADTLGQWDIDTQTVIRDGDPSEEILDVEESVKPTTTLIGSRGRSRLRRLMLGSVSEDVVAGAKGNVYLVPPARTAGYNLL